MVSSGNLLINEKLKIERARAQGLIHHEIGEPYALTYFNGKFQPFKQLLCGLARV